MANERYVDIGNKIIDMIKVDTEFADISKYYPNSRTLESASYPCAIVAKSGRETVQSELKENQTEDTLTYNVEVYYLDDHGHEEDLNKKDLALKNIIKADPILTGLVQDAQCYGSTISSELIDGMILTVLAARVVVWYES